MSLYFETTDSAKERYEWKLDRGGKLSARPLGKQRWKTIGINFFSKEEAIEYVTTAPVGAFPHTLEVDRG